MGTNLRRKPVVGSESYRSVVTGAAVAQGGGGGGGGGVDVAGGESGARGEEEEMGGRGRKAVVYLGVNGRRCG